MTRFLLIDVIEMAALCWLCVSTVILATVLVRARS
jgi:hypothetical protein